MVMVLVLAVDTATYVTAALGFAGVVVSATLTYLVAVRSKSGRIDTSDAETLWAEASAMRETYREETERLRQDIRELREEVVSLRDYVITLRTEMTSVRSEAVSWREEAIRLRAEVAAARARDTTAAPEGS